ncbi:hypothetical protein L6164_026181 [Bauhinia variegata]|uniref:Uncharacterized protein n=1 Tax=Bauhinia variegata TaxID=167791 RepID=A0ACB9LPJ9_BAUVA|nr:hypothetical protein L6164_026181 [Bauhinia variegata]
MAENSEDDEIVFFEEGDLEENVEECSKSLIGKVIAERQINPKTLETVMRIVWGNPEGFKVLALEDNKFFFRFKVEGDLSQVPTDADNTEDHEAQTVKKEVELSSKEKDYLNKGNLIQQPRAGEGMRNPLTVHALKEICKSHSPDVVFLAETKNNEDKVQAWLKKCKFRNFVNVNPRSTARGLVLAWNDMVLLTNVTSDSFCIACDVLSAGSNNTISLVGIHASSDVAIRKDQFQRQGATIVWGDFNIVLYEHEKKGGAVLDGNTMNDFKEFLMLPIRRFDLQW